PRGVLEVAAGPAPGLASFVVKGAHGWGRHVQATRGSVLDKGAFLVGRQTLVLVEDGATTALRAVAMPVGRPGRGGREVVRFAPVHGATLGARVIVGKRRVDRIAHGDAFTPRRRQAAGKAHADRAFSTHREKEGEVVPTRRTDAVLDGSRRAPAQPAGCRSDHRGCR